MSTSNNALLLTSPDFGSIRSALKNYLQSQSQFQDYNFDASNLSVILDVLAYNTYMQAFTTNMLASEMYLDTAQLDSSVISRAKELNYTPESAKSAAAIINIQIYPTDSPGTIVIPANTAFSTSIGNQSFTFSTDQAYTIIGSNGTYIASNVSIYEGFSIQDVFSVISANVNQTFDLSNPAVDISSISVYVTETGAEVEYVLATSILDLTPTSNVYFIQQDYNGLYQIEFGDGVIGYNPGVNAVVRVPYRVTAAANSNGSSLFTPVGAIAGYSNISVTTIQNAVGGAVPEDIESVRYYAPRLNQTRNRALTNSDYEVLLQKAFPEIQSIHAYGGETAIPPLFGQVLIAVKIFSGLGVPNILKAKYYNYIKGLNPTSITPVIVDPTFITLQINTNVYYDYTKTTQSPADLAANVLASILQYNNTNLNMFESAFLSSKFGTMIDGTDLSINSNITDVNMSSALNITTLATQPILITFNNPLDLDDSISSSQFTFANQPCVFMDDGYGTIFIRPVGSDPDTSSNRLFQAGVVNYETGTVNLQPVQIQLINNIPVKIYGSPANSNIITKGNTIITIDPADITINVIEQIL